MFIRRLWYTVCAALLLGFWFTAARAAIISLPYVRTCTAGTHVWAYQTDAAGQPGWNGVSCLAGSCLSDTAFALAAAPLLRSANPASAASAAIAAAQQFDLNDPAILAEVSPRGDLARERRAFARAHLKDVGFYVFEWQQVGIERTSFSVSAPSTVVRYGLDTSWTSLTLAPGIYTCARTVDGGIFPVDPLVGTPKVCQAQVFTDPQEPACPPPPPPTIIYVVSSTQAFPLKLDGTKSTTVWPVAPTLGALCDATVKVVSYGVTFMKVPSLSTPTQVVVAGCSVKK